VESAPSVVNPGFWSEDNPGRLTTDGPEGTDDTLRPHLRFPSHLGELIVFLFSNRQECHAPRADGALAIARSP
jgi:hypothetical protein